MSRPTMSIMLRMRNLDSREKKGFKGLDMLRSGNALLQWKKTEPLKNSMCNITLNDIFS